MIKKFFKKYLIIGIILLFVGASVTPSIYGADLGSSDLENVDKVKNIKQSEVESTPDSYDELDISENEEIGDATDYPKAYYYSS